MKKQNLYGGLCCLILAGIFFYGAETTEIESLYSVLLILLLLGVGIWNIIIYINREPYNEEKIYTDNERLGKEFAFFKEFIGEEAFQGRTGGHFTEKRTTITSESVFLCIIPVGIIPPEKQEKYYLLSREKADRLWKNFRDSDHLSSYESRDETFFFPEYKQAWGKWGGAIIIDGYFTIYSFSGFPELLDEAFVCWVAWQRKRMTLENLKVIVERRENNPYLKDIFRYAVAQQ